MEKEERPMKCPSCDGRGKSEGIACGELGELRCRVMSIPCQLCRGTGGIDNERLQAWEYGRKMRADRLKENRTLSEEATKRGIDIVTMSKMERGEIDARPQPPREDTCR
jgi:DnaJ-class molecular chaperone